LSTHLRLGLPSGLFPSGMPTNILYAFLFSPIRATCPAHLKKNICSRPALSSYWVFTQYIKTFHNINNNPTNEKQFKIIKHMKLTIPVTFTRCCTWYRRPEMGLQLGCVKQSRMYGSLDIMITLAVFCRKLCIAITGYNNRVINNILSLSWLLWKYIKVNISPLPPYWRKEPYWINT
jgi:hypothetical protein